MEKAVVARKMLNSKKEKSGKWSVLNHLPDFSFLGEILAEEDFGCGAMAVAEGDFYYIEAGREG